MTGNTLSQAELFNQLAELPDNWIATGFTTVTETFPDGTELTAYALTVQPRNEDQLDDTPITFSIMPRWGEDRSKRPDTGPETNAYYYIRLTTDEQSIPLHQEITFPDALRITTNVVDTIARHTGTPPISRLRTVAENTIPAP